MIIDPQTITAAERHQILIGSIVPRAIGWISSISPEGIPNLAPFSFFTGISSSPMSLLFCPANSRETRKKDTLLNVKETGEFVVNVATEALAEKMNLTSFEFPPEVDEFKEAGLTPLPSTRVKPPRVAESPINLEGKVLQIVEVGEGPLAGNVVIGEVVMIHVRDDLYTPDRGFIDPGKLKPIGRMGQHHYSYVRDLFEMSRPQPFPKK